MLDRKTPPTYHQLTDITLQLAEQRHLRNGVPLHIINAGTQEVVRLEIIFRTGSVYEDKNAQAFLTTKMLSEGTASYSAKEIANILDSHGAHLNLTTGFDYTTLAVYTLNKHLPALLPVIKSIVTEPVFPEQELDTLKDIKKQKLRTDNNKSAVVASKKFRNTLFANHPYGNLLLEENIDAVSASDTAQFFDRCFRQNFEIVIAGAIDQQVEKWIADTFDDIQERKVSLSGISSPELRLAESVKIHKKDSLQSSIRTGQVLFTLDHPDFHRFNVLNTILGGYFGSRLMKSIREEKGYTYGIYSSVVPMQHSGYFVIGTDVIGEFTQQTIEEIKLQIENLREQLIDAEELQTVKNYMLGSFLSSLDTPFTIADRYKTIYLNQLPLSYYDQYIHDVNQVSAEELQELALRYLNTNSFTTVIVGKTD
jgi:zinc protease